MGLIDRLKLAFEAVAGDIKALSAGSGAAAGVTISEHGTFVPNVASNMPYTHTFKKAYTKTPTVLAMLFCQDGSTRLLYGLQISNTSFTLRSYYFHQATQQVHYIVISNDGEVAA